MTQDNLNKVFKGALIAGAGAVLTYVTQWVTSTDFGDWSPVVVAVSSVLVNLVRKLKEDWTS